MTHIASIDLGSHTARLLIAKRTGPPQYMKPIMRKRAYIRLAEGFHEQGGKNIAQGAIRRTLRVLKDFAAVIRSLDADLMGAVATGVVREAENRAHFVNLISRDTGIQINVISGEEEARLTCKGALHSLNMDNHPFLIFDLGGGSTEFVAGQVGTHEVKSLPLGTLILTQRYLSKDPPDEEGLKALAHHVDRVLKEGLPQQFHKEGNRLLVGTGGTVTTLAAVKEGISSEEISPERMNGVILRREALEALFEKMVRVTTKERLGFQGLDEGRADVIPAGAMVVIRIMHLFKAHRMTVSLSDLLEGVLIDGLASGILPLANGRKSNDFS